MSKETRIVKKTDERGVPSYYTQYRKQFFGISYWANVFVLTGINGTRTRVHETLGGAKEALIRFKKVRCISEVVFHEID